MQTVSLKDSRGWPTTRCTSWTPSTKLTTASTSTDRCASNSVTMSVVRVYAENVTISVVRSPFFHSQGNHTELCKNCKSTYQELNELYGRMEKNQTMCIDIEDSVRMSGAEITAAPLIRWEERKLHPLEESVESNRQWDSSSGIFSRWLCKIQFYCLINCQPHFVTVLSKWIYSVRQTRIITTLISSNVSSN